MNTPVRVFCSHYESSRWADWEARCDDSCQRPLALTCTTHNDALEAALGHACLHHKPA